MQTLLLLPQPRCVTYANGVYALEGARRIVLEAETSADLLGAAHHLQSVLGAAGGVWTLSATVLGDAPPVGAVLRVAPERVSQPQGYTLTIAPTGITVEAHDAAGVFYAVCTLAQIIEQSGQSLPAVQISDWPDFPARGVMLDISRDKVPTLETLKTLVDMLASWKINQLQLYTEHTFAYTQHPDVWANASPFTGEDILELDAYCRARYVELAPNQNTFGHFHRWLTHDRYRDLAETHAEFETPWGHSMQGPFSLAPEDPASLALVRELFDELLPHFRSRMVNIGADETVDLGQGRSRAAVAERGAGRVYLDFLLKIIADVKARGHVAQFWGDIIIQHPELVPELPRDCIALEWGYEADHPFAEHGAQFAAAGIPFYVCPGTSSWRTLGGRTANTLGNTRAAAESGLHHGAIGYLNTDWGDLGHWQHLPTSYLGFAAGAAYAWALDANRDLDIAAATSRYAFRDASGALGRVAYELGDVNRAMDDASSNSTVLFNMFQWSLDQLADDPALTSERMHRGLAAIDAAIENISDARSTRLDAALITDEFTQAARMMRHSARRALLVREQDAERAAALRSELAADMQHIIAEQRRLWLARNQPGGLDDSVKRLEEVQQEYVGCGGYPARNEATTQ